MTKRPLLLCVIAQMSSAVIIALILFALFGRYHASSFVLGALIFIVANTYFVFYAFRFQLARQEPNDSELGKPSNQDENNTYQTMMAAHSFKRGLFGKLVLSAVGFALAFRFLENTVTPVLFAGFVTMIVLQVFLAARIAK